MSFMLSLLLLWLFITNSYSQYDGWTTSSQRLPKADEQMAIGYSGVDIYLIGGHMDTIKASRYEYNLIFANVTNLTGISPKMYGYSQYYTQQNNILYMVFNTELYSCDLTNKCDAIQPQTIGTGADGQNGCVTSNEHFIFVLGGAFITTYYDNLSILNVTSGVWITGPTMHYKRGFFSCAAHSITNTLYAIGGKNDSTTETATIEAIPIADIINENWSIIGSLIYPSTSTRAVIHLNNILVIGGTPAMNEIQVINCLNNVVTSGGFLSYGIRQTAAIIVENKLYAFGGHNNVAQVDTWQYLDLGVQSVTPTSSPITAVPTTNNPTTDIPTNIPTTDIPTTNNPTTNNPTTNNPTSNNPTTVSPTTDGQTPSTSNHSTISPTTNVRTTVAPTTVELYGVSIQIEFDNKMDVIIIINVTAAIEETVNVIVTDHIQTNCTLSNNDYDIKTSTIAQTNITTIDVTIIVCNEISQTNLRAVFESDLKTDLITTIRKRTDLTISADSINVIISEIIPKITSISTTSQQFDDIEFPKQKNDNSLIYILAAIGIVLACIVTIICVVCIYKFKKLDADFKTQELQSYVKRSANSSNTDIVSPTIVKVQSLSVETDIITPQTVTKGYDISIQADEFVVDGDSENENQEDEGIDIQCCTNTDNGAAKSEEGAYVTQYKSNKHHYPTPMGVNKTVGKDVRASDNADKETFLIEEWLKNIVQLSQYKGNFIDNGYATMQIIGEINTTNELIEIGIVSQEHQIVLLKEIGKLKDYQETI